MTRPNTIAAFDDALSTLEAAADDAKAEPAARLLEIADGIARQPEGIALLAERAHRFDAAGLFAGGPWQDASKLLAPLVHGSLLADGLAPVVEVLSDLRVVAIAAGAVSHDTLTVDGARAFLNALMVRNLSFLGEEGTEDSRTRPETYARARHLIEFLLGRLSAAVVLRSLLDEIDSLCAQRPILTARTRQLIERAAVLLPGSELTPADSARIALYRRAIGTPSPLSEQAGSLSKYKQALPGLSGEGLQEEAAAFAITLRATGLGTSYHALLLRHLAEAHPEHLAMALGLDGLGSASLERHRELTCELILAAIHPQTADSIYGLSGVLERALLSRRAVALGLQRLITLPLQPAVTKALQARASAGSQLPANAFLVAGALSVLGQPIGVGQGNNPTCQTARGLSLWSVHAAGYLLSLLIATARDGSVTMEFEGAPIESHLLTHGVATRIDPDLDAVSLVLVPHLDRIYDEMMRRAAGRGVDAHRWVNPAFYGRWVPTGFACSIDVLTQSVPSYDTFMRTFFATHHPVFNDGDELTYPNPVGLFVTDVHGRLLGAHAVSLRRIELDPVGDLRAYFFNPNNEGRQDWGHGVVTSVAGHGEIPGESSLPFAQFASRLYAYHYSPYEGGPPEAIPDAAIAAVADAAKESWGRKYPWA